MQYRHFTGYSVAIDGTVTNINTGKTLKPQPNNCGYLRVQLCNGSEKPRFFLHRVVAEIYVPNPNGLPQVNHIDGDKLNNKASNLEWCTASQNISHSFRELGKKPNRLCGGDSPSQKITQEQIIEAAQRRAGGELLKDIAVYLGVNRKYLGALLSGRVKRVAV